MPQRTLGNEEDRLSFQGSLGMGGRFSGRERAKLSG